MALQADKIKQLLIGMIIIPCIPKMKIIWYTPLKLIKNSIVELLDVHDFSPPGGSR
jgi:hypothetical protein